MLNQLLQEIRTNHLPFKDCTGDNGMEGDVDLDMRLVSAKENIKTKELLSLDPGRVTYHHHCKNCIQIYSLMNIQEVPVQSSASINMGILGCSGFRGLLGIESFWNK